jgi:hypothetical protein
LALFLIVLLLIVAVAGIVAFQIPRLPGLP